MFTFEIILPWNVSVSFNIDFLCSFTFLMFVFTDFKTDLSWFCKSLTVLYNESVSEELTFLQTSPILWTTQLAWSEEHEEQIILLCSKQNWSFTNAGWSSQGWNLGGLSAWDSGMLDPCKITWSLVTWNFPWGNWQSTHKNWTQSLQYPYTVTLSPFVSKQISQ